MTAAAAVVTDDQVEDIRLTVGPLGDITYITEGRIVTVVQSSLIF